MTIKEMRELTNLSQAKFGELLHIPQRTIQNWEYGVNTPTESTLFLIEYYLRNEKLI